ncbi:hypothetical protein IMG5_163570, partial [Ichthyophthirius multifiliis]
MSEKQLIQQSNQEINYEAEQDNKKEEEQGHEQDQFFQEREEQQDHNDEEEQEEQEEDQSIEQEQIENNSQNKQAQDQQQDSLDSQQKQQEELNILKQNRQEEELQSQNLQQNTDLLNFFFRNFQQEIQSYFAEFQQKQFNTDQQQQEQQQASILASDIPLVLRVALYYDNITIHAQKNDENEIFSKPNSYKYILDALEKYCISNKSMKEFDPNTTRIFYNDFVDFCYFLIYYDQNIYLQQSSKDDFEVKESQLEKQIKENIDHYEKYLSNNQFVSPQEKQVAVNMINNLKQQLEALTKGNKHTNSKTYKTAKTLEQTRQRNLKEIFTFYAKQQNVNGPAFTFDRIVHEQNIINLASFFLFLKQFGILGQNKYVTKKEISVLFKKYALNYKELDLEHFKILIEKVALTYLKEEEELSSIEKVEKIYQILEIDNLNKLKSKFRLLNQPFGIQEKVGFRQLPS